MKTVITLFFTALLALGNSPHLSVKLEAKRAIKLGNEYLLSQRESEGWWSDDENPAISALVLTALQRAPQEHSPKVEEQIKKGLSWLLEKQQEDGGIYVEGLATYNTATSIMALLAAGKAEYHPEIRKARAFLVGQQTDWDEKGKTDNAFDGGIGYGGTYKHSDMSNTHLALEAIYQTRRIALDTENKEPQLDWESALAFVSRCQNLTVTNDQDWATDEEEEKGGFVYFPGSSKAGEKPMKNETTALRSYGSMSYAGLLSLIYAELSPTDPRVTSVLEWLGEHFTVEENPGMKHQGLFYYYQAMAKSLATSGRNTLVTKEGKEIDWRSELGSKLVSIQNSNGSWTNDTSRWWENDSVLTTAYAVLALEQLYASM